jgi:hypothetical protein
MRVEWHEARTGNVLLKSHLLIGDAPVFRPEFRAGEDEDFFRRKIEAGCVFTWSAEALAFECIPPARWKRTYVIRRALLQGACETLRPGCGVISILKSAIAVPCYSVALPWALLFGQHYFMVVVEKLSYHVGKLLMSIGIDPINEEYV